MYPDFVFVADCLYRTRIGSRPTRDRHPSSTNLTLSLFPDSISLFASLLNRDKQFKFLNPNGVDYQKKAELKNSVTPDYKEEK